MSVPEVAESRRSIRRYLALGVGLVLLTLFGAGGWALSMELAGAVIAEGQVVVETNKKIIQSPASGIVAEIRVKDGDRVAAGDLLMRLDDTEARSSLAVVQRQIDELTARQSRLESEIMGEAALQFPPELNARSADFTIGRIIAGEVALFTARRAARAAQKDQYGQQIEQLNEQISGMQGQHSGKEREISLNAAELDRQQKLFRQQLTTSTELSRAAMDDARMSAELGDLKASIAATKGRISEIKLRIIQLDEDTRSSAGADLAEIRNNLAQLTERRVAAQEQLNRVEIRSPEDGIVQELAFHAVRGVVNAGQPVLSLVPNSGVLTVEARVRPQDIDPLHVGQRAELRFVAFNQRSTPEIQGEVTRISADVIADARSGAAFYLLRISIPAAELARLDGSKLLPGMPVEVFVATQSRTAMSYFTRPFMDQFTRAFREK